MTADSPERAVAEILRYARVVKDRCLHDASGEHDLISGGIIVCLIACLC